MYNSLSSISSIGAAGMNAASAAVNGGSAAQTGGQMPFSDLMSDAVASVNTLETQARAAVSGLMSGTGVDVHEAMIATQKASMAFELALSVRNKAVQAYQQVIGMQF